MAKINTKIRYLCQDLNGGIHASMESNKPIFKNNEWFNCDIYYIDDGARNIDCYDTLIDLDVDDYEFEDGILRRIENATTKN